MEEEQAHDVGLGSRPPNDDSSSESDAGYSAMIEQEGREKRAEMTYERMERMHRDIILKARKQLMINFLDHVTSYHTHMTFEPQLRNVRVKCCICNSVGDCEIHFDEVHHHLYACCDCATEMTTHINRRAMSGEQ